MRATLLAWGLFMLVLGTLGRMLLWAALGLVFIGLIETWVYPSEMRWITTALTLLYGLFLWREWKAVDFEDKAKGALLLMAVLVFISVTLFGTEAGIGYTILGQPTPLLARLLVLSSLWMTVLIFWPTPYGSIYFKTALIAAAAYGSIGFLGMNQPFETAFRERAFQGLPYVLQPAPFASLIVGPVAIGAGILASIKSWRKRRKRRGGVLADKWLEFSLITVATALGIVAMARVRTF